MVSKQDLCAPKTKRPESAASIERYGYHFLNGDIDEESCEKAIKFILEANLNREVESEYLTLMINSEGGNVTDGFGLIEVMQSSRIPVRTIGVGVISSMALLVFMAGSPGQRILSRNTILMSHQWHEESMPGGNHTDMKANNRQIDITQAIFVKYYEQFTDLDVETIETELLSSSDKWMTAAEAKKYGICDKVKTIL